MESLWGVRNRLGPKYPFPHMNGWNKPTPRCPRVSIQDREMPGVNTVLAGRVNAVRFDEME